MDDPHPPRSREKVSPEQAGDDALVYAYAVRHPDVSISGIAAPLGWSFERVDRAIAVYLQEKVILCKEGSAYDRFLPFARHPFLEERRRYYFSKIAAFLQAPAPTLELGILAHTYRFTKRADGALTLEAFDSSGRQVRRVRANACAHCQATLAAEGGAGQLLEDLPPTPAPGPHEFPYPARIPQGIRRLREKKSAPPGTPKKAQNKD